jgi:SAM-dependent methyltransferase
MGTHVARCPVCGTAGAPTVTRDRLPAMQNLVHRTRDEALAAGQGTFVLHACGACGFAWNATFDRSRLSYDERYDNAVPSAMMADYYDQIADYLGRNYGLDRGYVVDIGCGDGKFLQAIARRWPECRGLGVDPALPGDEVHADGRIRLVKGVFDASLLEAEPSLFVSRHVLEHIPDPVAFVRHLRDALGDRSGVALFVEVPDLDWIVDHGAFWDFCYEHCNYFTERSLRNVLTSAGFDVRRSRVAFGDQYRWIEGVTRPTTAAMPPVAPEALTAARLTEYAAHERENIDAARRRLARLRADGAAIALWGMATKGIIYSLLVDPDLTLIDFAVDVNRNKQGCYVPTTGRSIEAPQALTRAAGRPVAVVVMNLNYVDEIRNGCAALGVAARFYDATGQEVVAA